MAKTYSINLREVEKSLRAVQRDFYLINESLNMRRESMSDEVVDNIFAAYQYLNELVIYDVDLLALQNVHHLLELNHLVLCGSDEIKRKDFREHIATTTKRFYDQKEYSISHLRIWADKHKNDSPWRQAAGAYLLNISRPQLFFEGNHRTGALLMSSILVRNGKPPFVLTIENALGYFNPSTLAKETNKDYFGRYYTLPKLKKNFARYLKSQADKKFLLGSKKD